MPKKKKKAKAAKKKPQKPRNKKATVDELEAQNVELSRKAIIKAGGNIAGAAKALKINRRTLYRRIERHEDLLEDLTDVREESLDLAESKLMAAIKRGEAWAICFKLKCHGKSRGYVERQEITGKDGRPLNAASKAEDMSDAELVRIATGENPKQGSTTCH